MFQEPERWLNQFQIVMENRPLVFDFTYTKIENLITMN